LKNLLTAIFGKTSGSALSSDVGGRIFFDEYGDDPPIIYPYVVFQIIDGNPDNVFAKKGKDVLIQFSLFSTSKGVTEITTMHNDLIALFDECSMTITSNTLVLMAWQNLVPMVDEIMTPEGTSTVKHWAEDFEVMTQES
jgi:hypothetical protein